MATYGGFAAWTERAKDILVQELKQHFSLLFTSNVISEQPNIERYGLAGQTSSESFVNIFTALPHEPQRVPTIAVMSAPATERKMGIGRQVVNTFRDPTTGLPTVREVVGGDMQVIIEISAVDTNTRSEITDIVYTFFTHYMEERKFSFLGSATKDTKTGDQNLYQIILKAQATIQGETDMPRPGGEGYERIYLNRITVPVIFIDYVDREVDDFALRYNPNLEQTDDYFFSLREEPLPFDETETLTFANRDDFENSDTLSGVNRKWIAYAGTYTNVSHLTTSGIINGTGSLKFESIQLGEETSALLLSDKNSGVTTGKIRGRFNLEDGDSYFILSAMFQGSEPLTANAYHLFIKSGKPARMELRRGAIDGSNEVLAYSSNTTIWANVDLAAQLEWKIDTTNSRIRLRGYVTPYETTSFGALDKRLEHIDSTSGVYLTSLGEGFGFKEKSDATAVGTLVVDDVSVLKDIAEPTTNPSKVG